MRRVLLFLAVVPLLLVAFCLPAVAEEKNLYREQLNAGGGDSLQRQLPADVQALLAELQVDIRSPESFTALSLERVFSAFGRMVQLQSSGPLQAAVTLLAATVLSAMFSGLEGITERPALRQSYHTVSVLAIAGVLLPAVCALVEQVQRAVDSARVFLLSFVPVYGGVVAASGGVASALSYQTTLLAAAELFGQLCHGVVLPVLTVSMALGCTGAVAEGFRLDAISATLHRLILWGLGLFSTVFSGVLSVQQMVAAAGDSVSRRAMRFSLSSFVPVVGGVLSEAYATVLGCAGLLRSSLGCFGVIVTVLTVLPPLLNCVLWSLLLQLSGGAAALFQLTAMEKLCKAVAGGVRVLIAVLALFALLMVISTSVVVFAGRGSGVG